MAAFKVVILIFLILPIFPNEPALCSPVEPQVQLEISEDSGDRLEAKRDEIPPLNIAFIWELHHPLLSRPDDDLSFLPDFTQTALQDYLFFWELLESDFPELRINFAVSPSVILQLEMMRDGSYRDFQTELMLKEKLW